jgi:predicted type IV restriction endonuclease
MIPKKVCERMTAAMKRLAPVLMQQKTRDVSEADTVTLVKDLLADVFGYDKYSELTGELAIRGTFCDLAVKFETKFVELIEVKAIGIELNDRHVKQAIDYAANQGIEWVILTNAIAWRLYHVVFAKPIDKHLVSEIDITTLDCRKDEHVDKLFLFTKEGFKRGAHEALRDRQEATSRFLLAALLIHNDSVVATIRRELRRMVDVNVSEDEVVKVLEAEVIKRDALEGPPAEDAAAKVNRSEKKSKADKPPPPNVDITVPVAPVIPITSDAAKRE